MAERMIVLVGTTKGAFFYHTDPERRDWQLTGPHLGGWDIYSLLGDSRHGNRVYAGTSHFVYGPTIRVSDDLGRDLDPGGRQPGLRQRRPVQVEADLADRARPPLRAGYPVGRSGRSRAVRQPGPGRNLVRGEGPDPAPQPPLLVPRRRRHVPPYHPD